MNVNRSSTYCSECGSEINSNEKCSNCGGKWDINTKGVQVNFKSLLKSPKVILPFIISLAIVVAIVNWLESPREIQFGLSRGEDEVTLENKTNEFSHNQTFHYRFIMMGKGDLIQYTIERTDLKEPTIYYTETFPVPNEKDKSAIYGTTIAPDEVGTYSLKITNIQENWLIAEGQFNVR